MLKTLRIVLPSLVLFGALAILGPTPSLLAQATCPAGQTGTPPNCLSAAGAAQQAETKARLCSGSNLEFSDGGVARSCNKDGDPQDKLNLLINKIVNVFSIIVGIVAVIMIIYGGFRYITSGGDSGNVTSAKNTILYAIVGLVIVALAQFIVKFVLNKSTG